MTSQGQLTVYRDCTPVLDTVYKTEGYQTITDSLIEALAEAAGVAPTDLPPLYDTIDLEALTQLFKQHDGSTDSSAMLSFTYDTWNVFVKADGRIRVCDGTEATEPAPVFKGEPASGKR